MDATRVHAEYGVEPKFDSSDRPSSAAVLGRATWTMLHTTAAYLPDKLKPEEAAGFKDLVSSVVNLYPGDEARLIQSTIDDPIFRSEFDETTLLSTRSSSSGSCTTL